MAAPSPNGPTVGAAAAPRASEPLDRALRRNGRDGRSRQSTRDDPAAAVTVDEALRVVLPGGRVAGGAAGLSRRITWATSLRSRPPAFEPRGGGELVLATKEALESLYQADHSLAVARILEGLAQAGAAALACAAPPPADAAVRADELGVPLIEIPADRPLVEIEREIISLVVDRHNALQTRASHFYRQLAQLSVESQGLDAIIHEAAIAAGRVVAFEDQQFRLRASAAPGGQAVPPVADGALSSVEERARLGELAQSQPFSSTTPPALVLPAARWRLERAAAPVVTRERLHGYVSVCGAPGSLSEFDLLAASRLAAICALELAAEQRALAAEQRVQRDLVDELLRPYGDADAAARHAAQAGLARDAAFVVYAFGVEPAAGTDAAAAVADGVSRQLRRSDRPSLVRRDGAEVIVICQLAERGDAPGAETESPSGPKAPDRPSREIGEQVFASAASAAGDTGRGGITAGASRPQVGLAGLPGAAREAREALRIGRRVYGSGRLIAFADLGLYRVLHSLRDTPELASFYEQTLGPLVEYDRRTGQNLVETLEAFFASHGNLSETADRLVIHRNTLLYRIRRIQEIGGVDLEDPETRLSLQVALKAKRLLA